MPKLTKILYKKKKNASKKLIKIVTHRKYFNRNKKYIAKNIFAKKRQTKGLAGFPYEICTGVFFDIGAFIILLVVENNFWPIIKPLTSFVFGKWGLQPLTSKLFFYETMMDI